MVDDVKGGIRFEYIQPRPPAAPTPPPAPRDPSFQIVATDRPAQADVRGGKKPEVPNVANEVPDAISSAVPLGPAAARMRLSRQRHRDGYRTLWIDIHRDEIDSLVKLGYLHPDDRADRGAIEQAVHKFFEREL